MNKIIAIGLSPNTKGVDVFLATRLLFRPWRWVLGRADKKLEQWFERYFKVPQAVSFVNARSALYAILHCLGVKKGDEVLLQAFTCVVVPNAIIAVGAKPVYIDINDMLTIDTEDLKRKITKKTKAIIVQHTFGIPSQMDNILQIAKQYKLYVIEDVAHSIGGEYKGKKLGTLGTAGIYSFGRDKAFSSVWGGVAITSDKTLAKELQSYQKQKEYPSFFWVAKQLLYPLSYATILSLYNFLYLGKIMHFFLLKIKFFSYEYPATPRERKGIFRSDDVKKFPNALARLAILQVQRVKEYNEKRITFVEKYEKSFKDLNLDCFSLPRVPLMRFPLLTQNKEKMKRFFAKRNIYIGDWYMQAIDPNDSDYNAVYYQKGSCQNAEKIAKDIVNLPVHPTMTEHNIQKVIDVLKEYLQDNINAL